MKVALLVPGGVDRSGTHRVIPCLLWLIERLAREVELHVFAHRQEPRPARWPLLGAQVHNAGTPLGGVRLVSSVLAEHRRAPFQLLHAVWATPGAAAAVLGRVFRLPVLVHLTGGDLVSFPELGFGLRRTRRGRVWLRLALAGSDRLTVSSTAMAEAAALFGVRAERVPLGVALDRWPPDPPRPRDTRRPARLAHVASLSPVKDQATLLEAARNLVERGVDFRLDVVGEDTLGGRVQRLAGELGLAGRVTFHGFLTQTDLRPLVEAADLHVVSSRHESDSIVLLEAAVCGVPTVGTAVGHLTDWAPGAALTVPPGDGRALADGIESLLKDDARRLEMARAAQERALSEDADLTARRFLALYRELAKRRG